MSKEITCKEVMKYVCQCLAQDVSSSRCRELKEHLDDCTTCQEYLKSVEVTIDCYQKYNVEMPQDTHKKLMSFLDLEEE